MHACRSTLEDPTLGLAAIHAAGGFHGAVAPLAVEVLDDGRARLGFAGVQDAALAYQSPRRITDGELSASDDAWALVACLYFAVTGDAPFRGESAGAIARRVLGGHPLPIRAATPAEQALQKVFERAFSRIASRHYRDVATLGDELRAWLREHATSSAPIEPADASTVAETPAPSPKASSLPPAAVSPPAPAPSPPPPAAPPAEATPAPPAASPRVEVTPAPRAEAAPAPPVVAPGATDGAAAVEAPSAAAGAAAPTMGAVPPSPPAQPITIAGSTPRTARTAPAGVIAALAAGGLAIAAVALYVARPAPPPAAPSSVAAGASVERPPRVTGTVPAGTARADAPRASADVAPASASASASPAVDLDACVGAWFPPESFDPDTDLTFVCTERDGRRGAGRLRRAILAGGKGKKITDAMREWGRFGWFELPVYATLRASCCPGAPPLDVPRVAGSSCTPPHDAIQALATATAQHGDVGATVRGYRKVVSCLVEVGDYPAYGQPGAIGAAEEPAFRAFAERGRPRRLGYPAPSP